MSRIILLLLMTGILIGCESVRYISPSLPDYKVSVPSRPVLDADDPEGNVIELISYARKLEAVIEGWAGFYGSLQGIYGEI